MAFVPLHTHSWHSLLQGVPDIPGLVARAKALGYTSLALTDVNTTAGLILFLQECRTQGIKPILGVELVDPNDPERRLIAIARDAQGYGDLCEITTHSLSTGFSLSTFHSQLSTFHLYFSTPHPALLAELAHTALRPQLYGMLLCNDPITRATSRKIEAFCSKERIPLLASSDTHFLDQSDHSLHQALRAIAYNTTIERLAPNVVAPVGAWLRPASDMERLFARIPEAIANTARIADSCIDNLQATPWILPRIEVPAGHTPHEWLSKQVMLGLESNYARSPNYSKARLLQQKELATIEHTGYSSYFLMVKQIRDYAASIFQEKFRHGRECSIMRGSAANCLTFYNIGASDLDPVRYNLYFERFLNESRTSPPDADLDFGWDEREKILQYFFDTWGEDHVCVLCTTHTFRWRGAFREAAKVLGFSDAQVTTLFSRLREQSLTTPSAGSHWLDCIPKDPDLRRIAALAARLRGRPHFLGQHPGGVIVTNDPIWRHVGCQRSGGTTNRIISQIDMHSGIDFLGLVKFDILGNGSLSVLRDTLRQIDEQGFPDPEVWDLDKMFHDPGVQAQMREGGSIGVFYLESPAQSRLNKKAGAETFEEIGITSSLIRPAGTGYAAEFVRRHRQERTGERDWEHIHPALESILGETHDICVFQEDVTRLCVELAGLSFATADKVRKMMNSLHEGMPPDYDQVREAFVQGCMEHSGLQETHAREVWARVDSFRGFSFCKSHSLSYAQLSFRCAWLKHHYPAQFMAGVISNNHGYYGAPFYLDESRRMGLTVERFNINRCRWGFQGIGRSLIPGFLHVRRLTRASVDALLQERGRHGPYANLYDFWRRNPRLRPTEAETLAQVGAFECFGISRVQAIAELRHFATTPKSNRQQTNLMLPTEIAAATAMTHNTPDPLSTFHSPLSTLNSQFSTPHTPLPDYSFTQKCLCELEILGYMVTGNLLEFLAVHPAARGAMTPAELPDHVGQRIKVFGVPTTHRAHRTAKGEMMMFVSVQNEHGVIDCILWPKVYRRLRHLAESSEPLEVWGTVSEEFGTYSIEVERLQAVPWSPAQIDFEIAKQRLAQQAEATWAANSDSKAMTG